MKTLKYKDNEKDALLWLLWKGMEITKSNKKYDIFDRLYQEVSNESERQTTKVGETCSHYRRESIKMEEGWRCLDCGYQYIRTITK